MLRQAANSPLALPAIANNALLPSWQVRDGIAWMRRSFFVFVDYTVESRLASQLGAGTWCALPTTVR